MECSDGYITGLGTCFHDRVAELGVLERIFRGEYDPSLLIVYGSMRVGKSELLRYTLSRRAWYGGTSRSLRLPLFIAI